MKTVLILGYGSEDLVREVTKEYKGEAVIKPKGRLRKSENEEK